MKKAVHRRPPETGYERREIAGSVREAIGELKPKMRLPILLKYIEGLSYEEIADIMSIGINSAYKLLYKALENLQHIMGPTQLLAILSCFRHFL